MATFSKKGDKWQAQVAKKGFRKAKTFSNYEDAEAWSKEVEKDINHGVYRFKQVNLTVRELKRMFTRTQDRAKKDRIEHSLTLDSFLKIWELSSSICALSGLPFSNIKPEGCRRRPFYPSIDRINSRQGYVEGNVRFVCIIANIARSDFDDDSLAYLARGIVNQTR